MTARRHGPPEIVVLAGVNGAGKSSVAGAALLHGNGRFFNPDDAARRYRERRPSLSVERANALAWETGRRQLERAIVRRERYAFETTLGGTSLTALLLRAAQADVLVRVHFVGLDQVERHIARVRARVAQGGHDIPEARIRARFDSSRLNLIELLPALASLALYDNSIEVDLAAGQRPRPFEVMAMEAGRIVRLLPPDRVPTWAKPIVMAALRLG